MQSQKPKEFKNLKTLRIVLQGEMPYPPHNNGSLLSAKEEIVQKTLLSHLLNVLNIPCRKVKTHTTKIQTSLFTVQDNNHTQKT